MVGRSHNVTRQPRLPVGPHCGGPVSSRPPSARLTVAASAPRRCRVPTKGIHICEAKHRHSGALSPSVSPPCSWPRRHSPRTPVCTSRATSTSRARHDGPLRGRPAPRCTSTDGSTSTDKVAGDRPALDPTRGRRQPPLDVPPIGGPCRPASSWSWTSTATAALDGILVRRAPSPTEHRLGALTTGGTPSSRTAAPSCTAPLQAGRGSGNAAPRHAGRVAGQVHLNAHVTPSGSRVGWAPRGRRCA